MLTRSDSAFDSDLIDELISFLETAGSPTLTDPLAITLLDLWSQMFVEVAVTGAAEFLVTENLKHFPEKTRARVVVVSPHAFLNLLLKGW